MSDVTFQRADYAAVLPDWQMERDVIAGDRVVKLKKETYLPNPSTVEKNTTESDAVYDKYLSRSIFYNVTAYTLQGLIGAAFRKTPTLTIPGGLDFVANDVDGAGVSIYQQSQATLANVLAGGRAGLLADYPNVLAPASRADQNSGLIRPSIIKYQPEQIINWRTTKIGGVQKLSLVVLQESYEEVDGFGTETKTQYRVLRLDGRYIVEIWRKNDKGDWHIYDTYMPTDGAGRAWTEIPFTFVGAQNNDWRIDKSPMLELARLNVKHYQLGADWYNALHWAGQPQPTITGLSEAWRDWLQEKGVILGSRSPLLLPADADYKLATVTADTALSAELKEMESRMVAIGARLITPGSAVKTATEAQNDNETEHSVLSLAAENVSDAYTKALGWMAQFQNTTGEIDYRLNQDYLEHKLDAQMLTALVMAWQSGQYPESDLWAQLRKFGLIDPEKTDEDIKGELDAGDAGLGL